ncbi:MAG: chemotaxis protein MotB [Defluviimonas sp.]|uniref:OmpA/MotB family protein n=1 Tax=Albidovulum sp. TaxID=1872424 RepID=UPI001DB55608|nr:chemotaxis protein MotB [Paracoccaceae bacterium]MCC0062861.1 chemotaxis protein MotB [Defluviimonas sp.]
MAARANAAPVIIKRKKVSGGDGHHGGAWKVAYADFVTAMMAFFMLMWLLNATTEKQRKGIADYFSPTVPISRVSGGGDGSFGGESVFSEDQIAQNGTGASDRRPTAERQAQGKGTPEGSADDADAAVFANAAQALEKALADAGTTSELARRAAAHISTRVTAEGLVVELHDIEDDPLFVGESTKATPMLEELTAMLARVFTLVQNEVAVDGHIRSLPAVLRDNPSWDLSTGRATTVRLLMEGKGFAPARFRRLTGYSDRRPVVANPMSARNNRIELILLRRSR